MLKINILYIIFFLSFSNIAIAGEYGEICIGSCDNIIIYQGYEIINQSSPEISIGNYISNINASIYIDGNLYIDYSFFAHNDVLTFLGETNLIAENITIINYLDMPTIPTNYSTKLLSENNPNFNGTGNWLLFSTIPFTEEIMKQLEAFMLETILNLNQFQSHHQYGLPFSVYCY